MNKNQNTGVTKDIPEPKADAKQERDFSSLGAGMKIASFPAAGYAAYKVMDGITRDHIMDIETESSRALNKRYNKYKKDRGRLSDKVDQGKMGGEEGLIAREKNHASWREDLYENLKLKNLNKFTNKFKHLRRVDQQKAIIEGITVGSIILGAVFAIANSPIFAKPTKHNDEGQSR